MKPLTRADREFLLLAGAFTAYGLTALLGSLVVGRHVAVALATAAASAPVFALASTSVTPGQTQRFLEKAEDAPPSAPRESPNGQLARFLLASLVLAAPLALGSVVGLVLLFERLSPPFGALVEGLAAGVFLGFGFGYLRLSIWMKRWEARAGRVVWREAWPRRRVDVEAPGHRRRSPVVRYYLTPSREPDGRAPLQPYIGPLP
ncbi:MAG: hypothetical protein ABI927_00260 [Gaiellaceae bacterium]